MIRYFSDEAEAIVDAYTADEIGERLPDFYTKHYDEIEAAWMASDAAIEIGADEAARLFEDGRIDAWVVSELVAQRKPLWPIFLKHYAEIEDAAIEADAADGRDYGMFIGSPDAFSHDWRINP